MLPQSEPGGQETRQNTVKMQGFQQEVPQNGGYSMDSQGKGVQNSRNDAAKWPKLEENDAQKGYFEVGIEKNTPSMGTVTSQIGAPE